VRRLRRLASESSKAGTFLLIAFGILFKFLQVKHLCARIFFFLGILEKGKTKAFAPSSFSSYRLQKINAHLFSRFCISVSARCLNLETSKSRSELIRTCLEMQALLQELLSQVTYKYHEMSLTLSLPQLSPQQKPLLCWKQTKLLDVFVEWIDLVEHIFTARSSWPQISC